jgi:hypothetical protein
VFLREPSHPSLFLSSPPIPPILRNPLTAKEI